jgi:predicted SprT family Zn-dependent metalloprotease
MVLKKLSVEKMHTELQESYYLYNGKLFAGQLPRCAIIFQCKDQVISYFSASKTTSSDTKQTDEIVLNPEYFAKVPKIVILQRLVQEMVHLWQYHFGQSTQPGYQEWANKMQSIGLMPAKEVRSSAMEQPFNTSIIQGGAFQRVTIGLLAQGFAVAWLDKPPPAKEIPSRKDFPVPVQAGLWLELRADEHKEDLPPSLITKIRKEITMPPHTTQITTPYHKYSCPHCKIHVWGKPKLRVQCAKCQALLIDRDKKVQSSLPKRQTSQYYQAELF